MPSKHNTVFHVHCSLLYSIVLLEGSPYSQLITLHFAVCMFNILSFWFIRIKKHEKFLCWVRNFKNCVLFEHVEHTTCTRETLKCHLSSILFCKCVANEVHVPVTTQPYVKLLSNRRYYE